MNKCSYSVKKIQDHKAQAGDKVFVLYTPSKLDFDVEGRQEESIHELIKTHLLPLVDLLIVNAKEVFSFFGAYAYYATIII